MTLTPSEVSRLMAAVRKYHESGFTYTDAKEFEREVEGLDGGFKFSYRLSKTKPCSIRVYKVNNYVNIGGGFNYKDVSVYLDGKQFLMNSATEAIALLL